jgi:cobalt-zinc-cadmium efflux system outer membrane protein
MKSIRKKLLCWHLAVGLVGTPAFGQPTQQVDVLTLSTAADRLIQRNLSVEAARLQVSAAEQARVFARLRPRPTVNVSAENLLIAGPTPFGNLYEAGVVVSQPIELGGQARARGEVAERGITLAEARLAEVLRQRLFEMRRTFFETLMAQQRVGLDEESIRNFEELVRYSEVRLANGDVAPGEVMKLKLERIKYESRIANSRLSLKQSKIRLLELLGATDFSSMETLDLREPFEFRDIDLNLTDLKQVATTNRPQIVVAQGEVDRAAAVLKLEQSRSKGELVPYSGYKRVGPDNTVVAGVSIPLPFGNRNQAAIAQAEADVKVAENVLLQTRNRTLAEVETAFLAFQTAREQIRAFEAGVLRQADDTLNVELLSYREGAVELINLLEAQRTRTDIKTTYHQLLLTYYSNLFQLELVTGTDLRQ